MNGGGLFADRLVQIWAEPGKVGTGVAVGARGILTARHIVAGGLDSAEGIQVRIVPTGTVEASKPVWVRADCLYQVPDWDVAVLQARDQPGWVMPETTTPVLVALSSRPEPDCHCVGFPELDVQIDSAGKPLRQTTAVVGRLLPAGQARPPVMPRRALPPRWLLLDIETELSLKQEQWQGISGAPVVLSDGRLAAIVLEASAQTRQLFVIALNDVVTDADGFQLQLDHLAGVATVGL